MNYRIIKTEYEPAMTFEEIAAAMGCNKQTVWVIYSRALFKLRREFRRKPAVAMAIFGLRQMKEAARDSEIFPDWSE
jgi:DNA-directed RNA polymerase sigma subunit (sigma70/sigma32)